MPRNLRARLARLESVAPIEPEKPWVRVFVDGVTEARAYEKKFGLPYPVDLADLPHNVIFRVIL